LNQRRGGEGWDSSGGAAGGRGAQGWGGLGDVWDSAADIRELNLITCLKLYWINSLNFRFKDYRF